jgi:manganese/zinc/iron transport system ATP- binding protein
VGTPVENKEPVIICDSVSFAYGREAVLRDVSLAVERGSFLPFVGPNGAGKTTLLRVILGLLRPQHGEVKTPFGHSPPGYVPQHKAIDPLYPVSARQIVAMGLYPKLGWWRRPTAADRQTVDQALAELGLAGHGHKLFSELSGGMKQKTMIARAFASGAEVLIMDEPTSELDEDSEKEVLERLYRMSADHGRTVLVAHHGLDHVEPWAPWVCLVEHGRVSLTETAQLKGRQAGKARNGAAQRSREGGGRA